MEDEKALLGVFPMKGVMRFGKKNNLIPRFIGPFEVLERVGKVAYRTALAPSLLIIHLVFHVFMLRNYHKDKSRVLEFHIVQLDGNLAYEEEPMAILHRQVRKLSTKEIASLKVQ
ncbi:uncharacterized protein [Nicotiana sylvestris]|uniref:uncharacterized protein n=1 Tax=Nicotiana sylvestris TaxID=4096 RepID=UPI00388CE85C